MSDTPTKLHHVVFCVHAENQDRAAEIWQRLGLTFEEIVLPDLDLRVLLDWHAGIEIISPLGDSPAAASFVQFLKEQGEGVYSVVVRVDDVDTALAHANEATAPDGVTVAYRQHRGGDGEPELDEVMLAPVYGMPVTFLATERPD